MIGFQQVRDPYSGWQEYLLFNPWQGFLWLVTYGGHWSVVRRLVERPPVEPARLASPVEYAEWKGRSFRIFAKAPVTTSYVVGEFYWKVRVGMAVQVADYIYPPYILSRETYTNDGEETWSEGEYVEPDVIAQAFDLKNQLPEPEGIYLNQPNPFREKARQLKWIAPVLTALLILVQVIACKRAANETVFNGDYNYRSGTTNPVAVTQPFQIKGGNSQTVDFTMNAPVHNSWLELDIDLVNADTHQVVATFEQGIEFYSGSDSDGPWSEGSNVEHKLIPAIPPGQYYLTIDASADPALRQIPFHVAVVRDVAVWSNFWFALGLIVFFPLYCAIRGYSFENKRWADSDFSPYPTVTSDDDDD
jgi:hypothetical protein